jgi:NAD(P)-dependent dehydrogenase (short-subunit alcohol dehydrogenase family)
MAPVRLAGRAKVWQTEDMEAGTILVTGASRGIGLALVKELAAQGWRVLAGARHPAAAHGLQAAAREASPGSIDILTMDVRSDESVRGAAEEAAAKVRALDVLVNNAGVFPEEGREPLENLPLDCFEEAFAVNVVGVARVTRVFLPLLGRAGHPRVINISSLAGSIAAKEDSRHYCYSASKAALNMLTRAMAAELRPRGITVVAVTPGWVKTDMGGPQAPLTVEESARSLAGTIGRIGETDAGQFLDRDGQQGVAAW